jgi:endonuclease YncB( thermonuclease family)
VTVRTPRRIFSGQTRSTQFGGTVGHTVAVGLVGAVVGALVVLLAAPSDLFGRVPSPSGSLTADPTHLAVVDGETLRINETVVHLQGVEAPPRGRMCQRVNGPSFDCGSAAAAALADLVRGRRVVCHLTGRDATGYPQAQCLAGETELNRRLVAEGWARARAEMPAFTHEESEARTAARGLWRNGDTF